MARALLLALTCAAAASAASYADYSGVKMPVYGAGDYDAPREPAAAPPDDYRGHVPDAPASPDYKYEEEPRVKTDKPGKDSDEPEVWRKSGKKQRGLMRPPIDSAVDAARKYERDEDDVPKYRSSNRYPKHRSRLKPEPSGDEPFRRAKYSRDRKDDVSDIDSKDYFHVDKDDFPDDKSKDFDEKNKFVNEATTRRPRRKPRDRFIKRKSNELDFSYDDDDLVDQRMKADEELAGLRRTRPPDTPATRVHSSHAPHAQHEAHAREPLRPPAPLDDEDEQVRAQPLAKPRHKPYEDYDDYYDMKRVNSIKSKLPHLLRRPTTERPKSYLDMLWTNRRLLPAHVDGHASPPPTTRLFSPRPKTPTHTTTRSAPRRTRTTPVTTTTTTTTTVSTTTANATALSLAEKSRLSILKKDARKKGLHVDAPTAKPAVLMQVTRYLPTVVMVEPPSSMHPFLRVRALSDDSPARLEKVKQLMRQKLVAEAKSIHDLTNNWDELVCDYIDTALLENEPHSAAPLTRLATSAVLNACLVSMFVYF